MMHSHELDKMYKAIESHFIGFSDTSVKAALKSCWETQIAVVWTVDDVFSALNQGNKAISYNDALDILHEALNDHDANWGINWEVIRSHADGMVVPYKKLTKRQEGGDLGTWFINRKGKVVEWKGNPNE